MNVFELVATITLDPSEYESGLDNLKKETEKKRDAISSGMLKVAGAGAAAVGAFMASSLKTGAEFDKSMSQVAATMGTTVDEIQNLRDFALDMGATTAFSAQQAADALNYMALAGYDAETSMEMLPTVLNLAAAGGIDLARASDMVTDAQSALGLTLSETTALVDKMAMTSSKSNTSVEQLGDAILTVGGTAKTLAGGTTELAQALGLLADNGIKGAEGGTALRNIILSLSAPTDSAAKSMKKLGLEVFDAEGNMRPLEDVFTDLNGILGEMTQGEQTQVLSELFNKVDLKSVNALLATDSKRWKELAGNIDKAQGSAEAMAGTQLDNLSGDITLLKSAFEGLQIQISDKLAPAAREAVQFITGMIENFDTVGPIILGAATAFGVFAVAINIGSIIKKTATAMKAFNAVLAANPIGLIIALIAGLAAAFIALYNNNEDFRNKVNEIWGSVKKKAIELKDGIVNAFENIRDKVSSAVERIQNKFESLRDKFQNVKNKIVEMAGKLRDAFRFDFEIPHIKLPHFDISPPGWQIGDLLKGIIPTLDIVWYRKAYDNPYMFTKPTVMTGFGDGPGGEMVYGHDNLMRDIREAVGGNEEASRIVELLEFIVRHGIKADIDKGQLYKIISQENHKRVMAGAGRLG